ncbi:cytochrome c biogenesis protein ResB [Persicirhabdus sediminis]|uniref:Cytochrome c biogenesis protein ResB n=1 Tax=Persicirhabdus sediminis TaxID=454144 RepID=A0A8J7MDL6_9BACT|nr:cytochrome c biogenesis protein ResB [Persicirhabdus sediminis]MBK1790685.1 cytochrome c biogenesis protein ResB [Persicirhabdus sediminis]
MTQTKSPLWRALAPLASIRLTVGLLVAAMVLVYFATIAQADQGIWEIQRRFFRSFWCYYDFKSTPVYHSADDTTEPAKVLFRLFLPGGYLIGGLLLINLLLAPIFHYQLKWKKLGIWAIHIGVLLLLVSELFTGIFSQEGKMNIPEGGQSNYAEKVTPMHTEICLKQLPANDTSVNSMSSAASATGRPNGEFAVLQNDFLVDEPVVDPSSQLSIKVLTFFPNALIIPRHTEETGYYHPPCNRGSGLHIAFQPQPYNHLENNNPPNHPAALIEVRDSRSNESIGKFFCTTSIHAPDRFEYNGHNYEISLRPERIHLPFAVQLDDFTFTRYPGTQTPKDYRSEVTLIEPDGASSRQLSIWMNHPLRKDGFTLFQHSFGSQEDSTVLNVVKNPSWPLPYIAFALVTFGLIFQFSFSLTRFLKPASSPANKAS